MRYLSKLGTERSWSGATVNQWQAALSLPFRVTINHDSLDKNPDAPSSGSPRQKGALAFQSRESNASSGMSSLIVTPQPARSAHRASHGYLTKRAVLVEVGAGLRQKAAFNDSKDLVESEEGAPHRAQPDRP